MRPLLVVLALILAHAAPSRALAADELRGVRLGMTWEEISGLEACARRVDPRFGIICVLEDGGSLAPKFTGRGRVYELFYVFQSAHGFQDLESELAGLHAPGGKAADRGERFVTYRDGRREVTVSRLGETRFGLRLRDLEIYRADAPGAAPAPVKATAATADARP